VSTDGRPAGGVHADLFLIEDLLGDEERAVRDRVRAFCEREVAPVINDHWERAQFPFALLPGLARLGIIGGTIEGYGCPGLSPLGVGIVAHELSRCDGSLATFHGVQSGLAMTSIALLGSDEQKERWLPAMARLETIGAFALTEPDHGSDVVGLETRAESDGDGYVLHGAKRWIGNATFADVVIVWARRDNDEVGAFVVEKGAPGFSTELITGKTAKRASWQAEISLDGVRVPAGNRLPGALTFQDATEVLTRCRPAVAWGALGHAVAAYEAAVRHVTEREQFGRPLAGSQLVQYRLANMLADVTAMQLICVRMSQLQTEGRLTPSMASMAKMFNAAHARTVVGEARDLLGGNGILLEYDVARHHADMEAVVTVEGTDSVQALILGREITGIQAFS
jgi:glutaryl-CoA dehydrogenase